MKEQKKGDNALGNILSYLKWRGDLTFTERPFCEVDNLVLSELAYLDLAGIVPAKEERAQVAIAEAAPAFYQQNRKKICADGPSAEFFRMMAESNRYRDVRLFNFIELTEVSTQIDFSALHIDLGDGTVYVAFRGTSVIQALACFKAFQALFMPPLWMVMTFQKSP